VRELAAAADRHERHLAADREQREADRTHDRDLATFAELQRVFDDAVVGVERLRQAAGKLVERYQWQPDEERDDDRELLAEMLAAAVALEPLTLRLELRLTAPEPVITLRRLRSLAERVRSAAETIAADDSSAQRGARPRMADAMTQIHAHASAFRHESLAATAAQAMKLDIEVPERVQDALDARCEQRAENERANSE
jgi:hypothetical protein